ncbi:putative soluble starch synthase isoform X2 [Capsicum annuum]|nr:putative soluble starch synthase isoform X2 [Capsicum annuum]KAF3649815.1 putative soluble starch synthase isoform X2 [Capsicum annuum]
MKSSKMKTRNSRRSSMPSYYTYLKPGALAQIRNSKITAKSRVIAMYQQKPNSDIQVSQAAAATPPTMEGIPCFNLKVKNNRPCCLQRKKLSAVAPVFYEPNHDPSLVTI